MEGRVRGLGVAAFIALYSSRTGNICTHVPLFPDPSVRSASNLELPAQLQLKEQVWLPIFLLSPHG